jgi:hypothetical protein
MASKFEEDCEKSEQYEDIRACEKGEQCEDIKACVQNEHREAIRACGPARRASSVKTPSPMQATREMCWTMYLRWPSNWARTGVGLA